MGDKITTAEEWEDLAVAAQRCRDAGGIADALVLEAIRLGAGTRKELKERLQHFGYDAIEKALERQSGEIRMKQAGPIERFELVGSNGHRLPKAIPFDRPTSEKKAPSGDGMTKPEFEDALKKASAPVDLTCESCGNPRAPGSGRFCRPCYGKSRQFTPEQIAQAEELRAQGKPLHQIAKAFDMSALTFANRRQRQPELEEALDRGWDRWSGEPETETSPVGYIAEKKAAPSAPVVNVAKIREATGAQSMASRTATLAAPKPTETSPVDSLRFRVAQILCIGDPDSPVLTEALLAAEKEITAKILASTERPALDLNNLPSAVIKQIRDDDAFFSNAYDTLIGILDDSMDGEEKSAIWTLILYLKNLEKERYG